jgi:hypothetical protein
MARSCHVLLPSAKCCALAAWAPAALAPCVATACRARQRAAPLTARPPLPASCRRRREAEVRAFQQQHWQEMRAAAQRNRQRIMGNLREGSDAAADVAPAAAGPLQQAQPGSGEGRLEAASELLPPGGRFPGAGQAPPGESAPGSAEQHEWRRWQQQDAGSGGGQEEQEEGRRRSGSEAQSAGGSQAGSEGDAYEFAAMLMDMAQLVADEQVRVPHRASGGCCTAAAGACRCLARIPARVQHDNGSAAFLSLLRCPPCLHAAGGGRAAGGL